MNIDGNDYMILIGGVILGTILYMFVQPILIAPLQRAITGL